MVACCCRSRARDPRHRHVWLAAALAAVSGALLLAAVPLAHQRGDEGWILRVGRIGPALGGTDWIFWLLVPLGCAALVAFRRRAGVRSLPVLMLGASSQPSSRRGCPTSSTSIRSFCLR